MSSTDTETQDRRAQFDFEVAFSNGGALQGQGFRLDIDGDDIADEELAAGTYVDSPFHRYADGDDLSALPLDHLADLEAVVVDVAGAHGRKIGREQFLAHEVTGKAVLVRTGWDRHWRTDAYFEGHPHLTEDAARHLAEQEALLVGIDAYNIDDTDGGERPVHSILLGAGIPICEHLTGLEGLPSAGFRFTAAPIKVKGMGTFPVRAFAIID